ncbi:MAG: GGDEF domain-containing protein, partial [Acidimicrobiia bacterium]
FAAIFGIVGLIQLAQVPGAPANTQPWFLVSVATCWLVALVVWRTKLVTRPMAFTGVTVFFGLGLATYANFLWPDAWSYSAFYLMTFVGAGLIAPRWFALGVALPLAAGLFFVPFARHGVPDGIVFSWIVNVETWVLTYLVIRWTGTKWMESEARSRRRLDGLEVVLDSGLALGRADDGRSAADAVVVAAAGLTGADSAVLVHVAGGDELVVAQYPTRAGADAANDGQVVERVLIRGDEAAERDELVLRWRVASERAAATDLPLLAVFARQAATALQRAEAMERLRDETLIDALTGVGNRRRADALLATASPGDGVVLLDLDHFKGVNDRLGHDAGDAALRDVGAFLAAQLREHDEVARYGGEEFLLVVHQIAESALEELLQRLRERWNAQSPITTFSVGAAAVGADGDASAALRTADEALYRAKQTGRDRVVVAA